MHCNCPCAIENHCKHMAAVLFALEDKKNNKKRCACCGKLTLPDYSVYYICPVCGWEDDDIQNDNPDLAGGANEMALNQAKEAYKNGEPSI